MKQKNNATGTDLVLENIRKGYEKIGVVKDSCCGGSCGDTSPESAGSCCSTPAAETTKEASGGCGPDCHCRS